MMACCIAQPSKDVGLDFASDVALQAACGRTTLN
jgi:hypothetical protein